MWTVLIFIGFFVVVVLLVIKIDTLSKDYRRLMSQFKLRDQESHHVQQLTYELAEECSQMLLTQLSVERQLTRLTPNDLQCLELLCQAIPVICKDLVNRPQPIAQALQRFLKRHSQMEWGEMDLFLNRHGRLIQCWQKNTYPGYLQMCQAGILMAKENSHRDNLRPVRPQATAV